jgi:hypothetical protein
MIHQAAAVLASEQRQARICEAYLAGDDIRTIAAAEGISKSAVHRDLQAVRRRWRAEADGKYGVWIDAQLARIDAIEGEAWEAYERSKRDAVTVREEADGEDAGKRTVETKGQAGDAKFLRVMIDCVSERCRILGLYAPKQHDMTSGGQSVKFVAYDLSIV